MNLTDRIDPTPYRSETNEERVSTVAGAPPRVLGSFGVRAMVLYSPFLNLPCSSPMASLFRDSTMSAAPRITPTSA
jgi:hypothetical protein